jgi:hypothetical protein
MLMDDDNQLLRRLRQLGAEPIDPSRAAGDLQAMAGVRPSRGVGGLLGSKVRLAGAFLVGLLLGSTGLAAADALPDPAQHVAHTVLAQVGVDVPNPERYHGPECGSEVKRNHGAYVRDDHALAQSDCGKPVGAGEPEDETSEQSNGNGKGNGNGNGADKGPCHGRPPWAGNKAMTDAEVEAAKAARAELCGADDDEAEADEAEVEDDQGEVDANHGEVEDDQGEVGDDQGEVEDDQGEVEDGESATTTEAPTTSSTTTTTAAP